MFSHPTAAFCCFAAIVAASARAPAAVDMQAVPSTHCAVFSNEKEKQVANEAVQALGAPSTYLDVNRATDRERLIRECNGIVFAIGSKALIATQKALVSAKIISALVAVPEAISPGRKTEAAILQDASPERTFSIFARIAPEARRVGVVFDPVKTGRLISEARVAARNNGIELVAVAAQNVGEAVRAFHRFEKEIAVNALWLVPDGSTTVQETVYYALELAHWKRIPLIGLSPWYVANGALLAVVPKSDNSGKRAGEVARRVLSGNNKSATSFAGSDALIINARTAARLGLKIPDDLRNTAEILTP
ncbi:MAG: ABC transporter substrate binding protein [Deltaproteobacteria bacterium]|nr:ABC transporter substrate binding protein [Deltaproteobacteria bacterium]